MNRPISRLCSGLVLFALLLVAPPAVAQDGGASSSLSSSDVSDREIDAAAHIIVTMQFHRQEMRRRMMKKYDNPQAMDSTQRREARTQILEKRKQVFQQTAQEQNMNAQRLGQIMSAARTDSTLRTRVQNAVRALRQERMTSPRTPDRTDSTAVDRSQRTRPESSRPEPDSLKTNSGNGSR